MNKVFQSRNLIISLIATLRLTLAGCRTTQVQNIKNRKKAMHTKLQLFAISLVALFVMACVPKLIPIHNIHDQPIAVGLTQEQVKKAINLGANIAGWDTKDVSPGQIIATYRIRVHTVMVLISYTENAYSIDYNNSYAMKVHCSEEDKEAGRSSKITSGSGTCPDVTQPAYIHEEYQVWINELNRAISVALQS